MIIIHKNQVQIWTANLLRCCLCNSAKASEGYCCREAEADKEDETFPVFSESLFKGSIVMTACFLTGELFEEE